MWAVTAPTLAASTGGTSLTAGSIIVSLVLLLLMVVGFCTLWGRGKRLAQAAKAHAVAKAQARAEAKGGNAGADSRAGAVATGGAVHINVGTSAGSAAVLGRDINDLTDADIAALLRHLGYHVDGTTVIDHHEHHAIDAGSADRASDLDEGRPVGRARSARLSAQRAPRLEAVREGVTP